MDDSTDTDATTSTARVLLAVNDPSLRRSASAGLDEQGFCVRATTETEGALMLLRSFDPDIVMVDLRMRRPDGDSLFHTVRGIADRLLVGITAADDHAGRVSALLSGADDVVAPTVAIDELAARCRAMLRRPGRTAANASNADSIIDLGSLVLDVGRMQVRVHGHDIPVTRIEFSLLVQLCRRPAEVCTRAELLEGVWGPRWSGDAHVVDVHLSNLRRKLQRCAPGLRFIHTVRGIGFRLSSDLLPHSTPMYVKAVGL